MNPITSEQLQPSELIPLPSNNDLPQPSLNTFVQPTVDEQKDLNTAQTNEANSFQSLSDALFGGSTIESQTLKEEKKAGIEKQKQDLTDINNELNQKSLAFRREQEAIQTTPGLTVNQRNARLGDVSRRNNMELADLEVIRMARSNNLFNAESAIQKKVNAQFAEQERNVKALQFVYQRAEGQFKEELGKVAKKEERAYELAKGEYQALENEKLQLVRNAQANGAGNGVMSSILKSQSLEEAYKNAGSYGLSIDDKIKQAQLSKIQSELSSLNLPKDQELAAIGAVEKITDVENLINDKKTMFSLVGGSRLATRRLFSKPFNKSESGSNPAEQIASRAERADYISSVSQLIDSVTLDQLATAKERGVTFGALSQGELTVVASAGTRLGNRAIRNKSGEIVGFRGTEAEFEEDLKRIQEMAKRDYEKRTGLSYQPSSGISFDENGYLEVPDEFISNEQFFQ